MRWAVHRSLEGDATPSPDKWVMGDEQLRRFVARLSHAKSMEGAEGAEEFEEVEEEECPEGHQQPNS